MSTELLPLELTPQEIDGLLRDPGALACLMNYHHARDAEISAFEDGEKSTYHSNRVQRLKERGRSIMAEDLGIWDDDLLREFGFPVESKVEPRIPDGYVLVPFEPTEEMKHTGAYRGDRNAPPVGERPVYGETAWPTVGSETAADIYRAMLAAAPPAPSLTTVPAAENEWRLPGPLKAGHVTFGKGTHVKLVVDRLERLWQMAEGESRDSDQLRAAISAVVREQHIATPGILALHIIDNDTDEDGTLINSQFSDFMEGLGAPEDNRNMQAALISLGVTPQVVEKMMWRLVGQKGAPAAWAAHARSHCINWGPECPPGWKGLAVPLWRAPPDAKTS